jgi:hypothetical protein
MSAWSISYGKIFDQEDHSMKILDEKGRLFGKINLVDLLIVLLVLLLIAAVCWRILGARTPGSVATQANVIQADEVVSVRFKVLVSGAEAEYIPALERYAEGASLVRDDNVSVGKIVGFEKYEVSSYQNEDGTVVPVGEGERYNVVFTVEYTGKMNTNTLIEGKQPLRVGAEYLLRTVFIEIKGTIMDVEILDK